MSGKSLSEMTPEEYEKWLDGMRAFAAAFSDCIADGPPPHKPEPQPEGEPTPEPEP